MALDLVVIGLVAGAVLEGSRAQGYWTDAYYAICTLTWLEHAHRCDAQGVSRHHWGYWPGLTPDDLARFRPSRAR